MEMLHRRSLLVTAALIGFAGWALPASAADPVDMAAGEVMRHPIQQRGFRVGQRNGSYCGIGIDQSVKQRLGIEADDSRGPQTRGRDICQRPRNGRRGRVLELLHHLRHVNFGFVNQFQASQHETEPRETITMFRVDVRLSQSVYTNT